ncbi:MAG: hypothetical protein MJ252_25450 [archaeon]|nr:hypothetical protein [archaeon]
MENFFGPSQTNNPVNNPIKDTSLLSAMMDQSSNNNPTYPQTMNNQLNMYPQNFQNPNQFVNNQMPGYPQQNIPGMPGQPQQPSENIIKSSAKSIYNKLTSAKDNIVNIVQSKGAAQQVINLNALIPENFLKDISKDLKEINCQALTKSPINDITIISEIKNPRTVTTKFYEQNYTIYDIITEQMKWTVTRRYSDFVWLRSCLSEIFPMDTLPQLPKKKMGGRRFEQDFIEKRMKKLQVFLNEIINKETYKATDILISFLSTADRNYFESQMKLYNPKNLKMTQAIALKSLDGKTKYYNFGYENCYCQNSNINDLMKINGFFGNLSIYFKAKGEIIHALHKNLNLYNTHMTNAYLALTEIQKNFESLKEICEKVNLKPNLVNVFTQYCDFFRNWKKTQINQTYVIKDTINAFFKEYRDTCFSFSEIIEKEETLRNEVLLEANNLNMKKEKLWMNMDARTWELNPIEQIDQSKMFQDKEYTKSKMCYKETGDLNQKGILLGAYFNKIIEQTNNYLESIEKSACDQMEQFSDKFGPTLTDGIDIWSHLASNLKAS